MRRPRVYLAGPDVFEKNWEAVAAYKKAVCADFGLEGVFPMDAVIPEPTGRSILIANVDLIESCQAMLANIQPFRGISADVGTAFEMGYGSAKGLKVIAYTTESEQYVHRVFHSPYRSEELMNEDKHGRAVENFGGGDNLMVWFSPLSVHTSFLHAVAELSKILGVNRDETNRASLRSEG